MSRLDRTASEEIQLRFICNFCGALVNEWCRSNRNPTLYSKVLHSERYISAVNDGMINASVEIGLMNAALSVGER